MDALEDEKLHERKRFQLERLILFTDAVFAIAITLLIIEIKVPVEEAGIIATNDWITEKFWHLIPEWLGFFISFGVIGVYWKAHHRMFGFVEDYDGKLTTLNFLFLIPIVTMPFTTAFYTKWVALDFPFGLYCFNVALTGFCQILLWLHISHKKGHIGKHITPIIRKTMLVRSCVAPFVFFLAYILSFYSFLFARSIFMLIPILMFWVSMYFKKKGLDVSKLP